MSKTTLRQAARLHRCTRKTVSQRLVLFGSHARAFHMGALERAQSSAGIRGTFQLDELETFELDRRLAPLTVPVLIERASFFVLFSAVAPLPCRGGLSARLRKKKQRQEESRGKRRSGSRSAVASAFELLDRVVDRDLELVFDSDQKASYAVELRRRFGSRLVHRRFSSKAPRKPGTPLFSINHTLALMRDGVSRLVRRTWAASKKSAFLELHLWIWIAWRNHVRGITNRAKRVTPAMALRVLPVQLSIPDLLGRRVGPEIHRPHAQ